jgi:hypothetical protein
MGSVTRTETFVYGQPTQVVSPSKNANPFKTDVKPTPSVSSPVPGAKKNTQTPKKGKN